MANKDKQKKLEKGTNPDAAREDLDQFTVLQDTESAHKRKLSAREMEADERHTMPNDGTAQGALGKDQGIKTNVQGIARENDPIAPETNVQDIHAEHNTPNTDQSSVTQTLEDSTLNPSIRIATNTNIETNNSSTSNTPTLETMAGGPPHQGDIDSTDSINTTITTPDTTSNTVQLETIAPEGDSDPDTNPNPDGDGDGQDQENQGNNQDQGNKGHGNNEDGVDDDNPGQGSGGPNAGQDDDGIDEDEGELGNQGDPDPGADPNPNDNMEMGSMLEEGNGNGWNDMIEGDEGNNSAEISSDDNDDGWVQAIDDDDKNAGKGKGGNKKDDDNNDDGLSDMDYNDEGNTDDTTGGEDGGF